MADVLIVDDDDDIAEMLGDVLVSRGHRVRFARDGEDGLRAIAAERPDLVLLDIEMPLLDGPGMAYQMFTRDCGLERIPVVLLSGIVGIREVAARVGTPYFLGKPYSLAAVVGMCDRALTERTAPIPAARPVSV